MTQNSTFAEKRKSIDNSYRFLVTQIMKDKKVVQMWSQLRDAVPTLTLDYEIIHGSAADVKKAREEMNQAYVEFVDTIDNLVANSAAGRVFRMQLERIREISPSFRIGIVINTSAKSAPNQSTALVLAKPEPGKYDFTEADMRLLHGIERGPSRK